jgi:hypothetical protein
MARTEPLELAPQPGSKWIGRLLIGFLLFFLLSLTGLVYLLEPVVQAGFFLVAGWLWFLARVVPEMQFNWAAIGMFLVCSALVIGGLQWLGRALAEKGGWTWSRRWPWGIYLGCWVLFLAAMGFTGAVHQVGWLFRSGEPWVDSSYRKFAEFMLAKDAESLVRVVLKDTQASPDQVRDAVAYESRPHRDSCTVLCFPADVGPVRTVLVLPRSPEVLKRRGFFRIEADGSSRGEPGDQLAPMLDRLNAGNFEPLPQP